MELWFWYVDVKKLTACSLIWFWECNQLFRLSRIGLILLESSGINQCMETGCVSNSLRHPHLPSFLCLFQFLTMMQKFKFISNFFLFGRKECEGLFCMLVCSTSRDRICSCNFPKVDLFQLTSTFCFDFNFWTEVQAKEPCWLISHFCARIRVYSGCCLYPEGLEFKMLFLTTL